MVSWNSINIVTVKLSFEKYCKTVKLFIFQKLVLKENGETTALRIASVMLIIRKHVTLQQKNAHVSTAGKVSQRIMQTCPCNADPLTPHFYIVKLRFTGGTHYFLIFGLKHSCLTGAVLICTHNLCFK